MHILGESLITALYEQGVRHTFGLPGDFVIGLYDVFEKDGRIQPIVMTHEPGAGFAADAYARCKGLGVAMITYCVGGLNCVNAVAGAYAEKSPVLVISGGPGISERKTNALLHHRVKTFETQRNVYAEVCCRASILHSPADAPRVIGETIAAVKRLNRPGYIEIPRDLFRAEAEPVTVPSRPLPVDPEALCESVGEAMEMVNKASSPIIVVGIEVHRLRLADQVRQLARRIGASLVSTLESKSVLSEDEILGVYAGALSSSAEVRRRVEDSDCVLYLGAFMTEFDLGVYTAHLDPRRTISVSTEQCQISHHTYPQVPLGAFLEGLLACRDLKSRAGAFPATLNSAAQTGAPRADEKITMRSLYQLLQERLNNDHVVVCDVGDCLFAAIGLHVPNEAGLIAAANYTSMGFAVPGAIGAELGCGKRPIVLVGDGAFQMTGPDLSTAERYGLSPIVIVLDNGTYLTLNNIVPGQFNRIGRWDYAKFMDSIRPGAGYHIETVGQFVEAFGEADRRRGPALLDVMLEPDDQSEILSRFTAELAKRAAPRTQGSTVGVRQ
jgi:TPP-dependent 2-oxoacid decarboxylase